MNVKRANLVDRTVRYLEAGDGGRAVVFLHAFPLSADQWLPQMRRVPRGWRAIAPDLRGFGGARQAGPDAENLDAQAADVLALMTHLDIDRAVIAGLSMGGYIAFAIVRRARPRVSGLVLANTRATADSAEAMAGRDRMIDLVQREGAAAIAREMMPKLLGPATRQEQPDLEMAVRQLIEANAADGIAAALRAMKARPDASPMLPAIECPTLIVAGEEDALIPEADVEAMRRAIPAATRVTIPRAGHLTNLEAPGLFNDAIAAFLADVAACDPRT